MELIGGDAGDQAFGLDQHLAVNGVELVGRGDAGEGRHVEGVFDQAEAEENLACV